MSFSLSFLSLRWDISFVFAGYFVCVQQGGYRPFNLTQSRHLYPYFNIDDGFPMNALHQPKQPVATSWGTLSRSPSITHIPEDLTRCEGENPLI